VVEIGENIESIGDYAFAYAGSEGTSFTLTFLGETAPTMGSYVFYGTDNCTVAVSSETILATFSAAESWASYVKYLKVVTVS